MYAKYENGKWIEVRGNGVSDAILKTLGFVKLIKTNDIPVDNQEVIIELVGDICREFVITKEYYVRFDDDEPVLVSNKARDFLEAHFQDAKNIDENGRVRKNRWRIRNPEWKHMRRLVWNRWDTYIGEVLSDRFMFDDEGDNTGVSTNDLILHSFFGDWPIQAKNGKRVLTPQEIAAAKEELKSSLLIQRNLIGAKCLPTNETSATRLRCLEATADWVMDAKGLG